MFRGGGTPDAKAACVMACRREFDIPTGNLICDVPVCIGTLEGAADARDVGGSIPGLNAAVFAVCDVAIIP